MPTIDRYLPLTLRIIGGATMLSAVQFIAPTTMLNALGMSVCNDTGLFFARHWALVICCMGGLMFYSASRPELRLPVMFVVTLEKLALVLMVVMNASNPALAGMHPAAIFDGLSVLVLSALMLRSR
ncbi:hypothetical protein [Paraburkholderia sediminicola]|uniref:hypothetical protein n=1 Tax=Paraburkholderia sediminicola TaxID=458836 RepID=UPI0038BB08A2